MEAPAKHGRLSALTSVVPNMANLSAVAKSSFIINPRHPAKIVFDIWIGILTFYTILVLPWRLAFEQDAEGGALVFDYCLDVMFALDMFLCFRTGYYSDQDVYVSDAWKIAKKYVTGLFIADF